MMPTIQAGDTFGRLEKFEGILGVEFRPRESCIDLLPFDHTLSCTKQFFPFPKNMRWWNEFDGVSLDTVLQNWNKQEWFRSEAAATVHEVRAPDYFQGAPGQGMDLQGLYHPEVVYSRRLILGNFRKGSIYKYVFLGVYELDKEASMAYSTTNPYIIGGKGPRFEYPHCVWRRCSLDYEKPQQPAV